MTNPAQHPDHERPLIRRLINARIRRWLDLAKATEFASVEGRSDYERGVRDGVSGMRSLALANFEYTLTLEIIDDLRRAGLLVDRELGLYERTDTP